MSWASCRGGSRAPIRPHAAPLCLVFDSERFTAVSRTEQLAERFGLDFDFRDAGAHTGDAQKFNVHRVLDVLYGVGDS